MAANLIFLPTPSARRATHRGRLEKVFSRNFYPRPPRGGRPPQSCVPVRSFRISTHALREEGDCPDNIGYWAAAISTHALREEGDVRLLIIDGHHTCGFLPTPSARRATLGTVEEGTA